MHIINSTVIENFKVYNDTIRKMFLELQAHRKPLDSSEHLLGLALSQSNYMPNYLFKTHTHTHIWFGKRCEWIICVMQQPIPESLYVYTHFCAKIQI